MYLGKVLKGPWTLEDGVLYSQEMDVCLSVREALVRQGTLAADWQAADLPAQEWIWRRMWRYRCRFDAEEGDERGRLLIQGILSPGALYLNGRAVCELSPGQARVDVSEFLRERGNELEIRFEKPERSGPLGLNGPIYLQGQNFLEIEHMTMLGQDVETTVQVYTAGKYAFHYTMRGEADEALRDETSLRLRVGEHVVPWKLPSVKGRSASQLRLTIERAGIRCAQEDESFCPGGGAASRIVLLNGRPPMRAEDDERVAVARTLGANGVRWTGGAVNGLPEAGFLPVFEWEPISFVAPERPETLRSHAGDLAVWPPDSVLWRLTESPVPDNASDDADAETGIRLSRALQAERIRQAAARLRIAGKAAAVRLTGEKGLCASDALCDEDGAPRPAMAALSSVWRESCVCALLPHRLAVSSGSLARIPIWLLSDGARPTAVSVAATAFDAEGARIAQAQLTGFSAACMRLGDLTVDPARAKGCVRLKLEMDGEAAGDYALCVDGIGSCLLEAPASKGEGI